ncbi:hypothetical protein PTNB73_02777 [Pyrenophora teres f. teres]|nr:hypothetical protein HRS9139_03588 [Pyrenophora teres f. teres]KAE8871318.1 hypothetical protein PTNB73_02777 [Pyrenophora teres f. teres]
MDMTPEQLREQLPMPSFVTVTEPLTDSSPPPRADTPPPPPPSNMPQFVNYTAQSFGGGNGVAEQRFGEEDGKDRATLQWVANTHAETTGKAQGGERQGMRGELPVFRADGVIPFAE